MTESADKNVFIRHFSKDAPGAPRRVTTQVVRRTNPVRVKYRTVVFSIPFFVPAIYAIANSDLVLTVARRLIKGTGRISGVPVVEPPRELEVFPYFMAWHPRLTSEPAHAWFRKQIRLVVRRL